MPKLTQEPLSDTPVTAYELSHDFLGRLTTE